MASLKPSLTKELSDSVLCLLKIIDLEEAEQTTTASVSSKGNDRLLQTHTHTHTSLIQQMVVGGENSAPADVLPVDGGPPDGCGHELGLSV